MEGPPGIETSKFRCETCGKTLSNSLHLTRHIKEVHSNVKFKCPRCPKEYKRKEVLASHIKGVHERSEEFACMQCGRQFGLKQNLVEHMKFFHQNIRNYDCPACGQKFKQKQAVTRHMQTSNCSSNKDNFCHECGKNFYSKFQLAKHVRSAHHKLHQQSKDHEVKLEPSQIPFDLQDPSMLEETAADLLNLDHKDANLLVEDVDDNVGNERDSSSCFLKCNDCDKTFSDERRLRIHQKRQHHDAEECQCHLCGKWFTAKTYLSRHIVTSHTEKGLMCSVCAKMYTFKFALNQHMLKAHGVQPEKSFVVTVNQQVGVIENGLIMKRRAPRQKKKKASKMKAFMCSLCEDRFFLKFHLKKHIAKKHEVIPERSHMIVLSADGTTPIDNDIDNNVKLEAPSTQEELKTEVTELNIGFDAASLTMDYAIDTEEKFDPRCLVKVTSSDSHSEVGERSQCMTCGKWFSRKKCRVRNLFADIEGIRDCIQCDEIFGLEGIMRTHVENVRLFRTHYCPDCGKGFESESQLRCHEDAAHFEEVIDENDDGEEEEEVIQPRTVIQSVLLRQDTADPNAFFTKFTIDS